MLNELINAQQLKVRELSSVWDGFSKDKEPQILLAMLRFFCNCLAQRRATQSKSLLLSDHVLDFLLSTKKSKALQHAEDWRKSKTATFLHVSTRQKQLLEQTG